MREDSFSWKLFFEHDELGYVDVKVDPERDRRSGPKGHLPSATFAAMLLMYLQSMGSVLDLIRFLKSNPDRLVLLPSGRKSKG